jgi:DNA-directed RNA polymerase subunit RPC12/RpoP
MGETNDASGQSNFAHSLDMLNRCVEWVPHGWQALYMDMRRRLIAVRSEKRSHICIKGPWLTRDALYVQTTDDDHVVKGILRKTLRASRYICCECGYAGRPREIQEQELVLCPHCAGLRLLRADLSIVNRFLRRHAPRAGSEWMETFRLSPRVVALIKTAQPEAIEGRGYDIWRVNVRAAQEIVDKAIAALDKQLD